jgi:hypothetical protein
MCCCSLFFIFQISPTSSFIGKKQRKAASARVSESPIVELPVAVVVPHKERAQALITDRTASNATAMERAIDEIFAESGKVTTKSNPWKTLLKLVTADQRALLDQARAKRLSDVRSASGLRSRPIQHQIDAQALVADLTASNSTAKERAIEEIFAEGGKVTAKSKRWKALLKLGNS